VHCPWLKRKICVDCILIYGVNISKVVIHVMFPKGLRINGLVFVAMLVCLNVGSAPNGLELGCLILFIVFQKKP